MLTADLKYDLTCAGGIFFMFGFGPLVMLVLQKKYRSDRWIWKIAAAVASAWLVNAIFRLFIEVPVIVQRAQARGDFLEDGVGGNAVTVLFLGWMGPLIACLVCRAVFTILSASAKRRQQG